MVVRGGRRRRSDRDLPFSDKASDINTGHHRAPPHVDRFSSKQNMVLYCNAV